MGLWRNAEYRVFDTHMTTVVCFVVQADKQIPKVHILRMEALLVVGAEEAGRAQRKVRIYFL